MHLSTVGIHPGHVKGLRNLPSLKQCHHHSHQLRYSFKSEGTSNDENDAEGSHNKLLHVQVTSESNLDNQNNSTNATIDIDKEYVFQLMKTTETIPQHRESESHNQKQEILNGTFIYENLSDDESYARNVDKVNTNSSDSGVILKHYDDEYSPTTFSNLNNRTESHIAHTPSLASSNDCTTAITRFCGTPKENSIREVFSDSFVYCNQQHASGHGNSASALKLVSTSTPKQSSFHYSTNNTAYEEQEFQNLPSSSENYNKQVFNNENDDLPRLLNIDLHSCKRTTEVGDKTHTSSNKASRSQTMTPTEDYNTGTETPPYSPQHSPIATQSSYSSPVKNRYPQEHHHNTSTATHNTSYQDTSFNSADDTHSPTNISSFLLHHSATAKNSSSSISETEIPNHRSKLQQLNLQLQMFSPTSPTMPSTSKQCNIDNHNVSSNFSETYVANNDAPNTIPNQISPTKVDQTYKESNTTESPDIERQNPKSRKITRFSIDAILGTKFGNEENPIVCESTEEPTDVLNSIDDRPINDNLDACQRHSDNMKSGHYSSGENNAHEKQQSCDKIDIKTYRFGVDDDINCYDDDDECNENVDVETDIDNPVNHLDSRNHPESNKPSAVGLSVYTRPLDLTHPYHSNDTSTTNSDNNINYFNPTPSNLHQQKTSPTTVTSSLPSPPLSSPSSSTSESSTSSSLPKTLCQSPQVDDSNTLHTNNNPHSIFSNFTSNYPFSFIHNNQPSNPFQLDNSDLLRHSQRSFNPLPFPLQTPFLLPFSNMPMQPDLKQLLLKNREQLPITNQHFQYPFLLNPLNQQLKFPFIFNPSLNATPPNPNKNVSYEFSNNPKISQLMEIQPSSKPESTGNILQAQQDILNRVMFNQNYHKNDSQAKQRMLLKTNSCESFDDKAITNSKCIRKSSSQLENLPYSKFYSMDIQQKLNSILESGPYKPPYKEEHEDKLQTNFPFSYHQNSLKHFPNTSPSTPKINVKTVLEDSKPPGASSSHLHSKFESKAGIDNSAKLKTESRKSRTNEDINDNNAFKRRKTSENHSQVTFSSEDESNDILAAEPTERKNDAKNNPLLPAWVFCTRYSDRPSSGPRSRKPKRKLEQDEKRPRTAFTNDQLVRLRREFEDCRYLTEQRRQNLATELGLSESQIKIWFQNKRAKIKKAVGVKNPLAVQLMKQGLYNHSTTKEDDPNFKE